MSERKLLQPPEIVEVDQPVIFLAGPIQGAPDWQSEATRIIHEIEPSIVVASPRKNYPEGTFVYGDQVDWETYFLRKAGETGVVAFWLANQAEDTPGRSYGQTSRFELGEWKVKHENDPEKVKLALGIESGFGNEHYIRRRFAQDCPSVHIVDTLGAICHNAVTLIST